MIRRSTSIKTIYSWPDPPFHTKSGKSISDIKSLPYESSIGTGRYSRVQLIEGSYIVKNIRERVGAPYIIENVLDEINNLIRFKGNPYVVQLLGAEVYNTNAILVFPYVPGKTLFHWLKTEPSEHDKLLRLKELIDGLESLHEKEYVHLDIQPMNIWIPDDPKTPAFYLDLGSMYKMGSTRNVRRFTKTPGYHPLNTNLNKATADLNIYALDKIRTLMFSPPVVGGTRRRHHHRQRNITRRRITTNQQ